MIMVSVSDLEDFFWGLGEDWHLWDEDEDEDGPYPVERVFSAMRKFIEAHKSKEGS